MIKDINIERVKTTRMNNDDFKVEVKEMIDLILKKKPRMISIEKVDIHNPTLMRDKRSNTSYKDLIHIFDSNDYLCASFYSDSESLVRIYGDEKLYIFLEFASGEYKRIYISYDKNENPDICITKKQYENMSE